MVARWCSAAAPAGTPYRCTYGEARREVPRLNRGAIPASEDQVLPDLPQLTTVRFASSCCWRRSGLDNPARGVWHAAITQCTVTLDLL